MFFRADVVVKQLRAQASVHEFVFIYVRLCLCILQGAKGDPGLPGLPGPAGFIGQKGDRVGL